MLPLFLSKECPAAGKRLGKGTRNPLLEQWEHGTISPIPLHLPQHLLGGREPANTPLQTQTLKAFPLLLSRPRVGSWQRRDDPCGMELPPPDEGPAAVPHGLSRGAGGPGSPATVTGACPTPAGKRAGRLAASAVLCVAMGTECRCANCFFSPFLFFLSFLSVFIFLFLFFFNICHTLQYIFYLNFWGLQRRVKESFVPCQPLGSQKKPPVGRGAPSSGTLALASLSPENLHFSFPATDKSKSHRAGKVITLSST